MEKGFLFLELACLPHKDSHPSVTSCLNLFNAENIDVSVKHGYYEQFYLQQLVSENVHFQIDSSEFYFIDLTSIYIDLQLMKIMYYTIC